MVPVRTVSCACFTTQPTYISSGACYDAPVTLSIILPCFNEEANIRTTVRSVLSWLDQEQYGGEVIVVDDGSRDRSPAILADMAKQDSRVTVVTHVQNSGYGWAVRSGCDAATQDVIAFMDSDGQFHIDDLATLLPYLERVPFVTGRRRHRADSVMRRMFGKVLGIMNFLVLGIWVRDVNCGLKAFKRQIWPDIRPDYGVEKLFNAEVFLRMKRKGIPWVQVDVPHYPRTAGNPTGAKFYVIARMFRELWNLRSKVR